MVNVKAVVVCEPRPGKHGKPPIAMPAGSRGVVCINDSRGSTPGLGWSKFFRREGGHFMKILDGVLSEFVSEGLYDWSGSFTT